MDYEYREKRRYARSRMAWDAVILVFCIYFIYFSLQDFIETFRTVGWCARSGICLGGTAAFSGIGVLMVFSLKRKYKKYKEEFGD